MLHQDIIKGKWAQIKGQVRQKWGALTDDDVDQIAGNREKLIGKIQETYGKARKEAEEEIKEWEGNLH